MHPSLQSKIVIVLIVLILGGLILRLFRFLIPLIIISIVIGWVWDIFDNKGGGKKYSKYDKYGRFDDYEELD